MERDNQKPDPDSAEILEAIHENMMADHSSVDVDRVDANQCPEELVGAMEMLDVMERARREKQIGSRETLATAMAETDHPEIISAIWSELEQANWQESAPSDRIRIDGFEIVRQLGQGGYGLVFLARDPQLDRFVALKIPRPEAVMTVDLARRFMHEAKAAAALSHPNIVPVFEAGQAGPICFIASEFVEGETLAQWRQRAKEPLDPQQVASMVASLADAVAHAHQRGVLHRDLKPGNILLQFPDSGPQPLITDFGLAKIASEPSSHTRTDAIVGTPAYMSPEQASGANDQVGTAADIYSLGAIMYELLTGTVPFSGDSILETLKAVQLREPRRPRQIDPRIPIDLEAICLKCLEKNPQARYPSAADLNRDITRFLDGEPVVARPVTQAQRSVKWCRRNPVVASLLGGITVLLVTVALVSSIGYWQVSASLDRETAARKLADDRLEEAIENLRLAKQSVDEYLAQVGQDPRLKSSAMFQLRRNLLESAREFYTLILARYPDKLELQVEYADAYVKLATIDFETGDYQTAVKHYEFALETYDKIHREHGTHAVIRLGIADAQMQLAYLRMREGQYDKSEDRYLLAMKQLPDFNDLTKLDIEDLKTIAGLHTRLGGLYLMTRRPSKADATQSNALEINQHLAKREPEVVDHQVAVANSLGNVAYAKQRLGELQTAMEFQKQRNEMLEAIAKQHANPYYQLHWALSERDLGILKLRLKLPNESLVHNRKAVSILAALVDRHPLVSQYRSELAKVRVNLSTCLRQNRDLDGAIETLGKAKVDFQFLAEESPDILSYRLNGAKAHYVLGQVHDQKKDWQKGDQQFAAGILLINQILSVQPSHRKAQEFLLQSTYARARNQRARGNQQQEISWYTKVVETAEQWPAETLTPAMKIEIRKSLTNRADLHAAAKRWDLASADWDQAAQFAQSPTRIVSYGIREAKALARMKDHLTATAEIHRLKKSHPKLMREKVSNCIEAARVFSIAIQYMLIDPALSDAEKEHYEQTYRNSAAAWLDLAKEAGKVDWKKLAQDPDFRPIESLLNSYLQVNRLPVL